MKVRTVLLTRCDATASVARLPRASNIARKVIEWLCKLFAILVYLFFLTLPYVYVLFLWEG